MTSLSKVLFFQNAKIDIAAHDTRCRWHKFSPNEILLDYDDNSSEVYFILSGDVRILIRTHSSKEIILGEMQSGNFFGELSAIDSVHRSANVTALTKGEAVVMSSSLFRELVYTSPELTERLLRLLAGRVRDLNSRLMEYAVLDVRHRLYAELLRLSVARVSNPEQRVITPPPYHHILAARIGCRREQVTREFAYMQSKGMIERARGALVLLNPQQLEQYVAIALREDV